MCYNSELIEMGKAPLAHEISHLIIGEGEYTLSEGLACYVNDKIGNPTVMTFGLDPHGLAKRYLDLDEMLEVYYMIGMGELETIAYSNVEARKTVYQMSDSYVTYLIDTYGMDSFLQLYESGLREADYMEIYGKSADDVHKEWIEFLEEYELEYADEDIENVWEKN